MVYYNKVLKKCPSNKVYGKQTLGKYKKITGKTESSQNSTDGVLCKLIKSILNIVSQDHPFCKAI